MRGVAFPVRRALLDAQPAEPAPRCPRREPRTFSGPKQRKEHPHGAIPDWAVLEMRRAHENDGMPLRLIAPHMALLGIDTTPERVRAFLNYSTRSHLVPEPGRREPYAAP